MAAHVFIETNRLVLRTVTADDIEVVASSWKLGGGPISHEEAVAKVHWMQDNHAQNAPGRLVHLCLAIIDKNTQGWIGWCGLDHRDQTKENPVLFYLLKEGYWGRGLATEAANALIKFAFDEMGLARIDGGAAFENIASKRVMDKIGMQYLGIDEEGGYAFTITKEAYSHAQKDSR